MFEIWLRFCSQSGLTQDSMYFQIFTYMKSSFTYAMILATGFFLYGCNNNSINLFQPKTEREIYTDRLTASGFVNTKAGKNWLKMGVEVVNNPTEIATPALLKGSFKSKSIHALAWAVEVQKGTTIEITVNWIPADSSKLFIELLKSSELNKIAASFSPAESPYKFEADESLRLVIRIQPELFGEGNFTFNVQGTATYGVFPVEGKNNAAIMSFWGVARDGGARKHEGIDIFAPRGTPVVAPVDGFVTSVRDGGLGGRQVWMRDTKRGHNLYFAHLDTQAVGEGRRVTAGDILGFVGNTGNARFTKPHLHFGVYERGAFDPFPLVNTFHPSPDSVNLNTGETYLTVLTQKANVRKGPGTQYPVIFSLSENNPVQIEAAVKDWYQIKALDGSQGFIFHNLLGDPNHQNAGDSENRVFVFTKISFTDSLLIDLKDFDEIGSYQNKGVLLDSDGNIFFR